MLLREWGIPFEAVEPGREEEKGEEAPRGDPFLDVLARARRKCLGARVPQEACPALVLAADTLVVSPGGGILGKPRNREEARAFLRALSGLPHLVVSGVWVRPLPGDAPGKGGVDTTIVRFRDLSEEEIEAYLREGEWRGKAGGYALQGKAASFLQGLEGERENVVGLPRALVLFLLENLGSPWTNERS